MNASIALLAPLALLLSSLGGNPVSSDRRDLLPQPELDPAGVLESIDPATVPTAEQVRIEQRVIIRIAPIGTISRSTAFTEAAPPAPPRVVARKMGKCVAVTGIAAVRPDAGGTLLLYMRDQRLIAANLEKACSARDFYSGFYLERSKDGMLCAGRDRLHSRAGASCKLGGMRQLVAISD